MNYLFHGPETYISFRKAKQKAIELCSETDMEIVTIDAETVTSEHVVNKISNTGMFSVNSVYIIKRTYRNKDKERLIEYLINSHKDDRSSYIFWEDQKIKSNTKYFKHFGKNAYAFDLANKNSLYAWLKEYCSELGVKISYPNLRLLASKANYNAERIIHDLEKLQLTDCTEITESIINTHLADTLEVFGWDLTDAINRKDKVNALIILESLSNQQVDPNIILAMLAKNLKQQAQVYHALKSGKRSDELARELGIHPFVISKLVHSVSGLTWDQIKGWFSKLLAIDTSNKQGELDPLLGLTLLISRIN